MRTPRYQLARRRCRCLRRFVPTLGGAGEGATAGTPCRSCPKRGENRPIAAHEVKRRPEVYVRALDGVKSLVTRAGFQRARPFGHSCILLVRQKYAPGGIMRRPLQTPICPQTAGSRRTIPAAPLFLFTIPTHHAPAQALPAHEAPWRQRPRRSPECPAVPARSPGATAGTECAPGYGLSRGGWDHSRGPP